MTKYVAKQPDSQGFIDFTEEENETWQILYDRQIERIQGRACDEYIKGLELLNMPRERVPQCPEVSEILKAHTGWSVQPVAAIIPLEQFFRMLANKQFPAASFIRIREELDYLQEPDIFHEFFGHCPLLTNQPYTDYMQWYGELALSADKSIRPLLGRLFWFTIEFGLIKTDKGLRIYGGGILSSFEETQYCLESDVPERKAFDLLEVIQTDYRYDEIQKVYFVIEKFSDLYAIRNNDLLQLAKAIKLGQDPTEFLTC